MTKINARRKAGFSKRRKNKVMQYVIAGIVSVMILCCWIFSPLFNGAALSSTMNAGNPFVSKVVDIASLGDGYSDSQKNAPSDNPDSSERSLASLFGSGQEEEADITEEADSAAKTSVDSPEKAGKNKVNVPSPEASAPTKLPGKLNNSGSGLQISGGAGVGSSPHSGLFGTNNVKAEVKKSEALGDVKASTNGKASVLTALNAAADKGALALGSKSPDAAKANATSAFSGKKVDNSLISGKEEATRSDAAVTFEKETASADPSKLKTSDPKLNKHEVKLPDPDDTEEDEEGEWQQFLMQILQSLISSGMTSMLG